MDHPLLPLTSWFIGLPDITCPTCSRGHLEKKTKFTENRSSKSHQAEAERPDEFEPEWLLGVFTGMLTCSLAGCGESVAVAGEWETEPDPHKAGRWVTQYRLTYLRPAPQIVSCPPKTPRAVQAAVLAAAGVIWTDPSGGGNRLRVAVEELLTAQGIARTALKLDKKSGKNMRRHMMAGERIDLYHKHKPDVADVLKAVKWIGNSGSHASKLSAEDVLESAQILEHALRLLYDPSETELKRRIALVNRHKGPAPRKRFR